MSLQGVECKERPFTSQLSLDLEIEEACIFLNELLMVLVKRKSDDN